MSFWPFPSVSNLTVTLMKHIYAFGWSVRKENNNKYTPNTDDFKIFKKFLKNILRTFEAEILKIFKNILAQPGLDLDILTTKRVILTSKRSNFSTKYGCTVTS